MDKIMVKLLELEQTRECIEKYQKELREQMIILGGDEYLNKRQIYMKNKEELNQINKEISIINETLDIINNVK